MEKVLNISVFDQLTDNLDDILSFLSLKDLLRTYLCEKKFIEQTHNNQNLWKYHCDKLTILLKINKLNNPTYLKYKSITKLNNNTIRQAIKIYSYNPKDIESLLGNLVQLILAFEDALLTYDSDRHFHSMEIAPWAQKNVREPDPSDFCEKEGRIPPKFALSFLFFPSPC